VGTGSVFRRKSDGRWIAQVSSGPRDNRVTKRRVATSKGEATRLLAALQVDAGIVGSDPTMTVGAYLVRWLGSAGKSVLRPSTLRTYEIAVRLHIAPAVGHLRLTALRPAHVEAMLAGMAEMDPKGRRNVLNVLSRILAVAERRGEITRNPASLVERPRVPRADRAALTVEHARRLLDAVRGDRLEALYLLTLVSGLRQAEVLGLRWQDVDLEAGSLRVAVTLRRVDGEYVTDEPKTRSSRRTVALPPFAIDALREHRRAQLVERLASGMETADGFVFVAPTGRPINGGWLSHRWAAISKAAGLPIRFHDLRHGQATLLVALGVHPRVVSERLGHASSRVSMDVYSHVERQQDRDAATLLDGALRTVAG
jgi:integrase